MAELKSIKGRFERQLTQTPMIGVAQGKGTFKRLVGTGRSIADYEKDITSNFQSLEDLIKRYRAIKSAIVLSNAVTKVVINGEEMTVAEAIEYKNTIATMEKEILDAMKKAWMVANNTVEQQNARLQQQLENLVGQVLGNDRTKITEEQIKTVTEPKRNEFEPSLVDPLDLMSKISKYQNRIDKFLEEVDFTLSESNAKTMIVIEL